MSVSLGAQGLNNVVSFYEDLSSRSQGFREQVTSFEPDKSPLSWSSNSILAHILVWLVIWIPCTVTIMATFNQILISRTTINFPLTFHFKKRRTSLSRRKNHRKGRNKQRNNAYSQARMIPSHGQIFRRKPPQPTRPIRTKGQTQEKIQKIKHQGGSYQHYHTKHLSSWFDSPPWIH